MKRYFICCLLLVYTNINAQNVLWSSKILDFSTQFGADDFSAVKLMGPPDVPSEGGRHPNAWMAQSPDEREFISVGFDSAMQISQIAIFESFNPGAIYKVYLYDENNILHVIGTLTPKPASQQSRILHILLDETPYKVNAVRLIIDGERVPGYNAIDAIAISNSSELIQKRKNFAYRINPRLQSDELTLGAVEDESDTRPIYSERMKRLYFTRGYSSENAGSKSDPGDIMVAIYSTANNSFASPIYFDEEINNIGFNTTNGIIETEESEKLLLGNITGNPKKVEPNVVLVEKDEEGKWSSVEEQKIKKSGIYTIDVDYHITGDGKILFIAAEKKNSVGGRDIYISFNNGNNKWGEPENLGNVINTSEDEYAPFFSSEENALYFSSRGHEGIGGSDIYRVIKQDDTWKNWSNPENIGEDINSSMDEKYFYFDDKSSFAYFARTKNDSVFGIFRVERPRFIDPNPEVALNGRVVDESDNSPIASVISLFTIPDNDIYAVTFSDETTGLYNIGLRSGYDYKLVGDGEGYKPIEMTFSLENKMESYDYKLDLSLSKELIEESPDLQAEIAAIDQYFETRDEQQQEMVQDEIEEQDEIEAQEDVVDEVVSTPYRPNTDEQTKINRLTTISRKTEAKTSSLVRFNFNSAELLSVSFSILDAIAQFLQNHDFLKVEIGGFADHIGDEMYNVDLGRRRALAVKNYLANSGIARNRIKVIGFGEKMPIILSTDIEELQTNRRVEFNFTK